MRLVFALTVLPALPAAALVQPCYLDEMVFEAITVVQVTDQVVTGPDDAGTCILTGTVVRNFRGHLEVGTRINMPFACANARGVIGAAFFHNPDRLAAAGAVEIHVDAEGQLAGYGWGLLPIEAPTDGPAFQFVYLPRGRQSCSGPPEVGQQ